MTTAASLPSWVVETYLGVVAADAEIDEVGGAEGLGSAREAALGAAVSDAMTRGAHTVTGVQFAIHTVGSTLVLTATGTAVTLRAI